MWLFAHGILPGVTSLMPSARLSAMREAIASMPAEALSSLSAASSAESVSNPGRHTYVFGHRQREDSTHSPSAGSYHSGPETVGAAYIIAACSHHMVHRAGTTIRSVRRKPLDKLPQPHAAHPTHVPETPTPRPRRESVAQPHGHCQSHGE